MSTQPEALRLADKLEQRRQIRWVHSTGGSPRSDGLQLDALCMEAAAELRRLAAVETERYRCATESAQHFIRAREWAERAGALEAERDKLRAEVEALRRGEFICQKCGLRKDANGSGAAPDF